jgi:flagellar assembly protein FliH
MICKIAEADIETEELNWQTIGSASGPVPSPSQRVVQAAPADDLNAAGLKRRISEMEAHRNLELAQARAGGLEQGLKQGRQEAAAEMQGALDRLACTIQEVVQVKRRVRSEAENELVKLSLAIARRILHRELTTDPQSLRGVVYAALQRLQNREITRIRVFPAAVPAVRGALERNGGLAAIEIVADGLLPPGGLLFETSLGELDASVETQLQEIERGFTDRLQLK